MRFPGGHTMGIHLFVPFLLVGLLASLSSTQGRTERDCISAITSGTRKQAIEKAKEYVQSQIGNVQSYLTAKYEPLYIENLDGLHSLTVKGISSVKLIGSPSMTLTKNKIISWVRLGFSQLDSEADLYKKINKNYIVTGRLYTTIKGMELRAKFSFDLQGSVKATLDRVVVTKWGIITPNLVGSNVAKVPKQRLINYVKKDTPKIIETVFKKVVREYKMECPS